MNKAIENLIEAQKYAMSTRPKVDREILIMTLRTDQAGKSTFPEFLKSTWETGIVSYDVDLEKRKVAYYGALGEEYIEEYPAVEVKR